MRLCYSTSKAYLPALLMASLSAALVTSEPLDILLLSCDFTELNPDYKSITKEDAAFLESVLRQYNPGCKVEVIDMTEKYKADIQTYKCYKGHFSPYSFLRLFIDDFVDSGRILYIDVDTIVLKDLKELYHIDLQGNMLAMVIDAVGRNWMAADYCNSGVILFDLDAMKDTGLLEKCRLKVKEHSMMMPDQSAINKYFRDNILRVDRKFNEQQGIREDTVIRHYCRVLKFFPWPHYIQSKPWDDIDYFHENRKEYQCDHVISLAREYLKMREEGKKISFVPIPQINTNNECGKISEA